MSSKEKENRIMNFRSNGMHFYFNEYGISMIWGWGSYSNNYNKVQHFDNENKEAIAEFGKCADIFDVQGVYCQNVEIYPVGKQSEWFKSRLKKRYKTDDFPIGYVPVEDIPYILNLLKRASKLKV